MRGRMRTYCKRAMRLISNAKKLNKQICLNLPLITVTVLECSREKRRILVVDDEGIEVNNVK